MVTLDLKGSSNNINTRKMSSMLPVELVSNNSSTALKEEWHTNEPAAQTEQYDMVMTNSRNCTQTNDWETWIDFDAEWAPSSTTSTWSVTSRSSRSSISSIQSEAVSSVTDKSSINEQRNCSAAIEDKKDIGQEDPVENIANNCQTKAWFPGHFRWLQNTREIIEWSNQVAGTRRC